MKRKSVGLAVVVAFTALLGVAAGAHDEQAVRWDIIKLVPGPTANAGGVASAMATNASGMQTATMTMTGSGMFEVPKKRKEGDHVSGGGSWMITTSAGTTHGTYKVTGVVRWTVAPGTIAIGDGIGNPADRRAGLAVLRIKYSPDGDLGTLVVSCSLTGTPPTVFEGITASKGFTDFWKAQAPIGSPTTANANRTIFHVMNEEED